LARSLMAVAIAEGAIRGGKGGFGQGLGNMVMQGGNMMPQANMLPGKNMMPQANMLPGKNIIPETNPARLLPLAEKGAMWGGQKALGGAGMIGFAKMNAWVQGATALVTLMSAAMQKDKNQSWGKVAIKGLHDAGPSLISLGLMAIPGVGPALSVAAGLALPLIWDKIWSFLPQSWQDKDKPKAQSKYGSSNDSKAAVDISDRLFGSKASQEQFIQMQAMAQQERLLKATERNGNIQKMVVEHTGKTAAYTNATSKNTKQRFGKNPVGATTGNGDLAS